MLEEGSNYSYGAQSTMRRRTGASDNRYSFSVDDDKSKTEMKSKIMKSIKSFDLYTKTDSIATKKTSLGGFVSIFALIVITILVGSSLVRYLTVGRRDTLSVDSQVEDRVVIFFNISFPDMKCYDLHLDSVDASGDAAIDVLHSIHKVPVDAEGRITHLESRHKTKLGTQMPQEKYNPANDPHSMLYCGPCYVESRKGECCNTCNDVFEAYARKGYPAPKVEDIEQCLYDASKNHPGCNIYGTLDVQKVNGNFHFAPGRSFSQEYETRVHHIHEFNPILVGRFNSTHIVHSLTFGLRIPHVTYPLDNTIGTIPKIEETDEAPPKTGLFKYFIKAVPTTYSSASPVIGAGLFSNYINTYQFSFTKHVMPFDSQKTMMLPGVFFIYNFEPIRITYEEFAMPLTHFVVELMAVCAGVFVFLSYVDALLEVLYKRITKKDL